MLNQVVSISGVVVEVNGAVKDLVGTVRVVVGPDFVHVVSMVVVVSVETKIHFYENC